MKPLALPVDAFHDPATRLTVLVFPRSPASPEPPENRWTPGQGCRAKRLGKGLFSGAGIGYHPHLSKRAEMAQGLCIASARPVSPEILSPRMTGVNHPLITRSHSSERRRVVLDRASAFRSGFEPRNRLRNRYGRSELPLPVCATMSITVWGHSHRNVGNAKGGHSPCSIPGRMACCP